ncbi:MAG: NAD(P)-binding domain-containing protein [Rhodobiaceae bacterium]|nr:NAD(P)-binding domain-containing protein [Rhodobiaceae bacterium]MCC0057114.1 NAD(P)-binding domain-containing protein [Rhodobiaceae bacterium]
MKIAIIGNGNVGSGLAGALVRGGHDATAIGRDADIASAVRGADVVVLATPFGAVADVATAADFADKIVIDVSNPVTEDFSELQLGHDTSAAEHIAAALPGARVVKAFNTIFAQHYGSDLKIAGAPLQTFVASDDEAARETVMKLATDMGLAAMNAGALKNARYLEPIGFMNIQFGYALGQGVNIAPQWLAA